MSGEYVTRANRAREAVAALAAALRAPPLGGRDYDDFPLQEDALAVHILFIFRGTKAARGCGGAQISIFRIRCQFVYILFILLISFPTRSRKRSGQICSAGSWSARCAVKL